MTERPTPPTAPSRRVPTAPPTGRATTAAARRAPTDLPLAFATEAFVGEVSRANDEPAWRRADRLAGLRRYAELPAETNRLFTPYLDYRALELEGVRPYRAVRPADADGARLAEGASAFLHVREDRIAARVLSAEARTGGLFLGTFAEARGAAAAALRAHVERGVGLQDDDRIAQLTRAAYGVGILVHVPAGLVLEGPIVVRWSVARRDRGLLSRTVVVVEENAQAKLLEELDGAPGSRGRAADAATIDGAQALWTGTSEVVLGRAAVLDVASLGEFGPRTVAFVDRTAELADQAQLRWAVASVGGAYTKSRIDNRLVGRGSSVRQAEIVFGSRDQHFDLTSYTRHLGEDTTSDLLSKGVLQERSRNFLKGLITIERSATGSDSFLGEFGMLLGKKARSVAIPALEIDQPNVRRASHSSSVGPLDETQLFYLQSRGIDRETARKMIVLAYLEPVVARIPLPDAQERLRGLLDRKWLGSPTDATGAAAR